MNTQARFHTPLVRITGTVAELQTSETSENFVFQPAELVSGNIASIGLAAAGMAGAATGAAFSSNDAADKVTAFACMIGTTRVTGRFGEVTFSNGDEVEVVGAPCAAGLNALAVVRAADRTIWMYPHCGRGTRAFRRYCLRWIPTLAIAIPTTIIGIADNVLSDGSSPWELQVVTILAGAPLVGLVLLLVAHRFRAFAVLSDQIFRTLQFDSPEAVDLHRRLAQANRALPVHLQKHYHPWKRWVYRY